METNDISSKYENCSIEELILILNEMQDEHERLLILSRLGSFCWYQSRLDEGINYLNESLKIARKLEIKSIEAQNLNDLAISYSIKGENELASNLLIQAIEINVILDNKKKLMGNFSNLGSIEFLLANYNMSLEYFLKALSLAEDDIQEMKKSQIYNNLGIIYSRLRNYHQSLYYHKLSYRLKRKLNFVAEIPSSLINIGNIYRYLKEYNLAFGYYKKALVLMLNTNNKPNLSILYNNMADICLHKNKVDEALEYLNKSLVINSELDLKHNYCLTANNLGAAYIKKKEYRLADHVLNEALPISIAIKDNDFVAKLYDSLAHLAHAEGKFEQAYNYKCLYSEVRTQTFNNQLSDRFKEVQNKIDFEKRLKEAEIHRLRNIELVEANTKIETQKKELEGSNARLTQLYKEKEAILGIVSHDIRNYIGTIHTTVNFYDSITVNSKQKKMLEIIDKACEKSLKLVNDLLEASHIESQDYQLELKPEAIDDFFEKVIPGYYSLADGKNISIRLLPYFEKIYVNINHDKFCQICLNIISNAVKFTPENGTIFIYFNKSDDICNIVFEDTGIGIPEDKIPILFDKFTKASRRGTANESTTGLGLSIVKRLVELHHGSISVVSTLDHGTKFTVSLPLA